MPIGSIISQPDAGGISAAYRPVVLRVSATATTGDPIPPVVYCDIYFNNVFYKTLSKTQYTTLSGGNSEWEFDIQDAAQEFLGKFIGVNGGSSILTADALVVEAKCLFRSSGLDDEGFIQPEDTVPVQGTGDQGPTAGGGTETDSFFIVNAALQHEDNQDLAAHLEAFKRQGTWDAQTFPLSHRPLNYKLCEVDSDYFPILSDKVPASVRIHYVPKDGSDYTDPEDGDQSCIPVSFTAPTLPNGFAGDDYDFSLPLSGTGPFVISGSPTKPAWMDIEVDGSNLVFSGTPTSGDTGTGIEVTVTVQNCGGDGNSSFTRVIAVTSCVGVSFSDFSMGDAVVGTPYSISIPLSGTAPFAIASITDKPAWLSVAIVGSNLVFSGTPSSGNVGTDIPVELSLSNCGGGDSGNITETISVIDSQNFIVSSSFNMSIDSVAGTGIPSLGSTGINATKRGHHTAMSGSYSVDVSGTVILPTIHLDAYVDGALVSTQHITAAGTFSLSITASEAQTVSIFINS